MSKHEAVQTGSNSDIQHLLDGCLYCVGQCADLLQLVPTETYVVTPRDNASVGAHMRHILDRYHCFFRGLGDGCIDYDNRGRDPEIESNLEAARFSVTSFQKRFEDLDMDAIERQVQVREAVHRETGAVTIPSTVAREMMGLITHSVHHLAIIALLLKARGIAVDPDFGKAPSTLIYERS